MNFLDIALANVLLVAAVEYEVFGRGFWVIFLYFFFLEKRGGKIKKKIRTRTQEILLQGAVASFFDLFGRIIRNAFYLCSSYINFLLCSLSLHTIYFVVLAYIFFHNLMCRVVLQL